MLGADKDVDTMSPKTLRLLQEVARCMMPQNAF